MSCAIRLGVDSEKKRSYLPSYVDARRRRGKSRASIGKEIDFPEVTSGYPDSRNTWGGLGGI